MPLGTFATERVFGLRSRRLALGSDAIGMLGAFPQALGLLGAPKDYVARKKGSLFSELFLSFVSVRALSCPVLRPWVAFSVDVRVLDPRKFLFASSLRFSSACHRLRLREANDPCRYLVCICRWRAPKRIGRLDGHFSRTELAYCDS